MFTERQFKIIAGLKGAGEWVKGSILAETIGVSVKTLQMDIKKINEQYQDKPIILSNNRLGYLLDCSDIIFNDIQNSDDKKELNSQGVYGRSKQILMLLLFEKDYIKIGDIADKLFLSKSTINTNLAQVRRIIERTLGVNIEVSASRGIRIQASENRKRIICMKAMENKVDYATILGIDEFNNIYYYEEILSDIISKLFIDYDIIATGESYKDFIRFLSISILRSKLMFEEVELENNDIDIEDLVIEISSKVKDKINYVFSNSELYYIQLRVQELNLIKKKKQENQMIIDSLNRFEKEVYMQTGYSFNMDKELIDIIANHIMRMKKRILSGRTNIGNYTKELSIRYPLEQHLLKTCLCSILGFDIPESELDYLVLYLTAAIEKNREKVKLLLVSDKSASIIYNLQQYLKYYIGERITEIETIPLYIFKQKQNEYISKYKLFITTEEELALKSKRFFLINQFIISDEVESIRKKIKDIEKVEANNNVKKMYDRYFRREFYGFEKDEEITLDKVLRRFKVNKDNKVSIESIGSKILCVTSHSRTKESSIKEVIVKNAFTYKRKQISKLLIVHYGGNEDMVKFFDLVKTILNSYI